MSLLPGTSGESCSSFVGNNSLGPSLKSPTEHILYFLLSHLEAAAAAAAAVARPYRYLIVTKAQ